MECFNCTSLNFQYQKILESILDFGEKRKVRSFETLELTPFSLTTDQPLENIISNPIRKINRAFSVAEFLWIMAGRNDVEMLKYYNSNICNFSDNGIVFRGSYGPEIQRQFEYVLNNLKNDRSSRQAIINIWKKNPTHSKDIPCTILFQFLINQSTNNLNMLAFMRSNDAWLGFPYDIYNFTMIQNYMAYKLNCNIGRYTHIAASEHLYKNHFEIAREASKHVTTAGDRHMSEIITSDQLSDLTNIEEKIRASFVSGSIVSDKDKLQKMIEELDQPWQNMGMILLNFLHKKAMKNV